MSRLSDFTPARVGLGTAGDSVPMEPLLKFRLDHARARDAVHFPLDSCSLLQEMAGCGWAARSIHSAAGNREEYLRRPDKGRVLDADSAAEVSAFGGPCPIVFVVADGLSALAVHRHAVPLLERVFGGLETVPDQANPVWVAQQARVAIGDQVGELLASRLSIMLIGERPGLSAPDSLGIYLTWQPRRGRNDSERNCISNIHAQGIGYESAAHKLLFLIAESQRRKLSGVRLKELAQQGTARDLLDTAGPSHLAPA
jgi:ethanolamine ammonia-lyase small subunit